MVAVESRPFVFPREWPVRNSLVAYERHSRTRVCRHEVSSWKGTGLRARDLCVCTGADRGCTCQRNFGSRTFDRSEDCGKAQIRWIFPKMRAAFSARTSTGTHLPWNQSRRNDTCARLLWVAGRADATGRAGSDLRSVCTRHATARATLQQRQGTCGRGQRQEFENAQRSPVAGNALPAKSGGEPPPLRTL